MFLNIKTNILVHVGNENMFSIYKKSENPIFFLP